MNKLTPLLTLSLLFTIFSLTRGDFDYNFHDGAIPDTFTTEGVLLNWVDPSFSFRATAEDYHLRMWDGENKKVDEGGTRLGFGIDAEVFAGNLLVSGQVNTTPNTNDRVGVFGRAQGNLDSYFASVSFDSHFEYGRFMVGKSFPGGTPTKYIRSLDIGPEHDSSYYIELDISDDPTWGKPEVTGRLFDHQGGQLLAQIGFLDTNIGGVAPYTSGQAGVFVETWSEGLLDATFDNISAVTPESPPMELTWDNGSADGNWDTDKNWKPDRSPDLDSVVTIDTGDAVTLDAVGRAASGVRLNNGRLHVTSIGTLAVTGTVDVQANGTLSIDGALVATRVTADGNVSGNGTIHADPVDILRTVSPGNNGIGTLTLGIGEMGLGDSATYDAQLSLATSDADRIEVSENGTLQLGGTLAVTGVDRTDADSWQSGAVRTVVRNSMGAIGDLPSGTGFEFDDVVPAPSATEASHVGQGAFLRDVTYTKTSTEPPITTGVDLELFIAIGGDADGDGMVWLNDWGLLRQNFSNTGSGLGWTDGNFDPWIDDKVWLSDWGLLRSRFANADYTAAEGAVAAAVPEPGMIAMLVGGLAGSALVVRRRRRTT